MQASHIVRLVLASILFVAGGCGEASFNSSGSGLASSKESKAKTSAETDGGPGSASDVPAQKGDDGNDGGASVSEAGEPGGDSESTEVDADLGEDEDAVEGASIVTADDVLKACKSKLATEHLQTILFEESKETCHWGKDGNGPAVNRMLAARYEQEVAIDLPKNSLICSLDFDFPSQQVRYDDHIFLVMDQYVLATSDRVAIPKADWGNLVTYDWDHIKTVNASISPKAICLGGDAATCTIPLTERTGKFQLDFPESSVAELSVAIKDNDEHSFRFVTTGDNDAKLDCKHLPVTFDVKVRYLKMK